MVLKCGIFEFVFDLGNFRELDQWNYDQIALNKGSDIVVIWLFLEVDLFFSNENATGLFDVEFILI